MPNKTIWDNQDGLSVGFGERTVDNNSWSVTTVDGVTTAVAVVNAVDILAAGAARDAAKVAPNSPVLPKGTVFVDAEITTLVGTTSGGNLIFGAAGVDPDGTYTLNQGSATANTAWDVANDTVRIASTLGAITEDSKLFFFHAGVAFTAGQARFTVRYRVPQTVAI